MTRDLRSALPRRWLERRPRPADDRGSMAMLLMVTIVGLMLSALLIPIIIEQDRSTRFDITRVHALDAAQSGVDTTLGLIRAAVDSSTGIGDSTALPCGPVAGRVDSPSLATYSVVIEYFTADPLTSPTTPQMICAPGHGTYEPTSNAFTPSYARLTSVGIDGTPVNGSSKGRTLVSTYVFKTSNTNIPGGVIRIYPAVGSTATLCMDAGSAIPSSGTTVVLQTCSTTTPPAAQQVFTYRNDLTIQLSSSVTVANPDGLCLDTVAPPSATNPITVSTCKLSTSSTYYTQQWSFNDSGAYEASLATSKNAPGTLSNLCINVATQVAGQAATLATCVDDTSSSTQAWIPAPSVGAGAAVPPQWINYLEFGRCLDVTGQDVNATHLIDFPCKQNPYSGAVAWNQKFNSPTIPAGQTKATGQMYTTKSLINYCLTTPAISGGYVTVKVCGSVAASLQTWTVYNGDKALPYASKFTIVDSGGRCFGLTTPAGSEAWSAIDVEPCTGASEQKWNATANLSAPTLQNTTEK
jgi:hypothetical protein